MSNLRNDSREAVAAALFASENPDRFTANPDNHFDVLAREVRRLEQTIGGFRDKLEELAASLDACKALSFTSADERRVFSVCADGVRKLKDDL